MYHVNKKALYQEMQSNTLQAGLLLKGFTIFQALGYWPTSSFLTFEELILKILFH